MIRLALAALIALATLPVTLAQQKLTADDIARRVQDRDTGRDSRAAMRMKLFDRQNRPKPAYDRVMALSHRLTSDASGAPHASDPRFQLALHATAAR